MSRALRKPVDPIDVSDPLLKALWLRKGETTYLDFAAEVAHTESMLRAFMSGRSDAGLDTLCALMVWDQTLEPMILERMRNRGQKIRERVQTKAAQEAA